MTDSKEALSILHEQVVGMLIDGNPDGGSIRCALMPDWVISHDGFSIRITGPAADDTPAKTPFWLTYSHSASEGSFTVTAECEAHLYDVIGLLLEAWRFYSEKPNESPEQHLRQALEAIANRWKRPGDPISDRDQRALIGELRCVIDAEKEVGLEAIESWDSTGHELYDLESENWIIESKATSTEPETVSISYPEQVDFRIKKTLVLGVTRLNAAKKDGQTFPEFVEECLSQISNLHGARLETSLAGRGYSRSLSQKFSLKWTVHGTRYLQITEDSHVMPCEILEDLPATVSKIGYRLKTADFPESDLSTLIGV